MHSSYCMLAHGKILRQQFYAPDQLAAIAQATTSTVLAPMDQAIMHFAEQIVRDAAAISEADIQPLRDHSLTDAEIFDIAAAAAALLETVLHIRATPTLLADYLARYDRTLEELLHAAPLVAGMAAFAANNQYTCYVSSSAPESEVEMVEVFRKGDVVDFSLGIVKCGLSGAYIRSVKQQFPNAGFHLRLVQLELGWLPKHPLNPLPVFKW